MIILPGSPEWLDPSLLGRRHKLFRRSSLGTRHGHYGERSEWMDVLTDPRLLGGCVLWLRSDLGITLNGSNVSAWADQSGNGNSVTQGTAATQPVYNTSDAAFGGYQSLTFTATKFMSNATTSISQADTFYAVALSTSGTVSQNLFDGVTTRQVGGFLTSGAAIQPYETAVSANVQGGATSLNTGHALCYIFNGASSAVYQDSSATAVATGNPGANNMTGGIFVGGSNGVVGLVGNLVELIAFTGSRSAEERARVFRYFANRYKLGVS